MKDMLIQLVIFLTLYLFVFYVLRLWMKRYRSDIGIVTIRTSQIPVTIIGVAGFLRLFLLKLADSPSLKFLERGLLAIIVLTATIWIIRLTKEVLIYTLKELAQKSEKQWDDVLIPFVETTLPIFAYAVGIALFLQTIGIDVSGLIATLGGAGLVVGFAVQPVLANFFSGLFILIDSPFRFGDVITIGGTQAVIKKIGLRLTTLYVIDKHCDLYIPNSAIQSQSLLNVGRPTSHYYYTLKIPVTSDSDPARVVKLIESVIIAHPDTLGNVSQKLEKLESFYGVSAAIPMAEKKRNAAKLRLLSEQAVNEQLLLVEQALLDLSTKISQMEQGGLSYQEIKQIQDSFLDICRRVGLDLTSDYTLKKQMLNLQEFTDSRSANTLISNIRNWYKCWINDPNLLYSDKIHLPKQWERKIGLLKRKLNQAFKRVNRISVDETRIDVLLSELRTWMQESFKTSRTEWQDPKIWVSGFSYSERTYSVRFYVDDVTLEHYQRGQRVKSEVNQELTWQLRKAYLAL